MIFNRLKSRVPNLPIDSCSVMGLIGQVRCVLSRNRRINLSLALLSPLLLVFLSAAIIDYRLFPKFISWSLITVSIFLVAWVLLRVYRWFIPVPISEAAVIVDRGTDGKGRFLTLSVGASNVLDKEALSVVATQAQELIEKFNLADHVRFSLERESKVSLLASPVIVGLLLLTVNYHLKKTELAPEIKAISETEAADIRNMVKELPKLPEALKDNLLNLADIIEDTGLLSEEAKEGVDEVLNQMERSKQFEPKENEPEKNGKTDQTSSISKSPDNKTDLQNQAPPQNQEASSNNDSEQQSSQEQEESKTEQSGEKESQGKQSESQKDRGKDGQSGNDHKQASGSSQSGSGDSKSSNQGSEGTNQQGEQGSKPGAKQGNQQGSQGDSKSNGGGQQQGGSDKTEGKGLQTSSQQTTEGDLTSGSRSGQSTSNSGEKQGGQSKQSGSESGNNNSSAQMQKVEDKLNEIKQEMNERDADKHDKAPSNNASKSGTDKDKAGGEAKEKQTAQGAEKGANSREENLKNDTSERGEKHQPEKKSETQQGDPSHEQSEQMEPKSPQGESKGTNSKESLENTDRPDQSQKRDTVGKENEHGVEGDRSLQGSENKGKDADRPLRMPKPGNQGNRNSPLDGGNGESLEGTKTGVNVEISSKEDKITVRGAASGDKSRYANTHQAKEKTQIREVEFTKPEAEEGKEKQPIPVEYRDWLK